MLNTSIYIRVLGVLWKTKIDYKMKSNLNKNEFTIVMFINQDQTLTMFKYDSESY